MDYKNFITIEPGKRSGKPCIRGLRITVTDVLEYLASGMTVNELLVDFPDLTAEDIRRIQTSNIGRCSTVTRRRSSG
jgi:uncharacterized protein (DUF433 family)